MLKWAVNGPKRSYLPSVRECDVMHDKVDSTISRRSLNSLIDEGPIYGNVERRRVRRKGSDLSSQRRKFRLGDKENHLTSTPLPVAMTSNNSPLRKLDSLKDLSNITADEISRSPLKSTPLRETKLRMNEEQLKLSLRSVPAQYASTLPTFDVEYSPCGVVPGPILALRGIGIADTYFDKPRYLTQHDQEHNRGNRNTANTCPAILSNEVFNIKPIANGEDSLISSTKMGDMTLERMIDAILESARKERKVPKSTKQDTNANVMSPTYTPADDPASDLDEFWDPAREQYYQKAQIGSCLKNATSYNEREVRSPLRSHHEHCHKQQQQEDAFQLRRQRAVRRKRNMTMTTVAASVKTSAQKMFFIGDVLDARTIKFHDQAMKILENQQNNQQRNISPDSGRNSPSDYEDSTLEGNNLAAGFLINKSEDILDTTKRRLSFSSNKSNEC